MRDVPQVLHGLLVPRLHTRKAWTTQHNELGWTDQAAQEAWLSSSTACIPRVDMSLPVGYANSDRNVACCLSCAGIHPLNRER